MGSTKNMIREREELRQQRTTDWKVELEFKISEKLREVRQGCWREG